MAYNANLELRRLGVDRFLTQISLGIQADQDLIGDKLFPVLMQDYDQALIAKFGAEAFALFDDAIGDRGVPKKLDMSLSTVKIEVDGHAAMVDLTPREAKAAATAAFPYDLGQRKLYTLKQSMLLQREYNQAALAQNVTLYGSNYSDLSISSGANQFDNPTGDPISILKPVIEQDLADACGRMPNTLAFASNSWRAFITNPVVRKQFYGQVEPQGFPTTQQVANLLGVPNVIVGRAVTRNADFTFNTRIWTNSAILAYVPPVAGQEIPSFAYTIEQNLFSGGFEGAPSTEDSIGGSAGASEIVSQWYEQKPGIAGLWQMKRGHLYTPALLFPAAGWLFENCLNAP